LKARTFNFRLDDDDALSPAFLDRVVEIAARQEDRKIVSFDRGYYLQRLSGAVFRVHEKFYPKNAQGLGIFSEQDSLACIFGQGLHHRIEDRRVLNVSDRPYWIRTMHALTDSGKRTIGCPLLTLAEACEILAPEFGHLPLERALMALPETTGENEDVRALRTLYGIQ
jgi:hypothetical protein